MTAAASRVQTPTDPLKAPGGHPARSARPDHRCTTPPEIRPRSSLAIGRCRARAGDCRPRSRPDLLQWRKTCSPRSCRPRSLRTPQRDDTCTTQRISTRHGPNTGSTAAARKEVNTRCCTDPGRPPKQYTTAKTANARVPLPPRPPSSTATARDQDEDRGHLVGSWHAVALGGRRWCAEHRAMPGKPRPRGPRSSHDVPVLDVDCGGSSPTVSMRKSWWTLAPSLLERIIEMRPRTVTTHTTKGGSGGVTMVPMMPLDGATAVPARRCTRVTPAGPGNRAQLGKQNLMTKPSPLAFTGQVRQARLPNPGAPIVVTTQARTLRPLQEPHFFASFAWADGRNSLPQRTHWRPPSARRHRAHTLYRP